MQKLIIFSIVILIILSSCKLKDPDSSSTNPVGPGTGDVTITVVAPNGGEILSEGSAYQIQWTGTGTLLVKIQYSIDNGTSWGLVVDSLKNTGIYNWFPVPNTISNQCRIRITSSNGLSSDESDKVFAIVKNSNESLQIKSPNGGESWEAGSTKEIKWFSSGLDSVKLQYTTDNGQHWNLIAVDKKNTGVYYWQRVPNTPSTLAKIRIMDAKDGVPSTESTNTFTILPEPIIKIISPNGGEKILAGTSRKIEWISENIENVKIAYTTDNGGEWKTIIASTPAIGFYIWAPVPNVNSQLCKIQIYDAVDGVPSGVSDSVFTITNQISQTIEVTSPNGGERWQAGTSQKITWNSSGVTNVKLEFTSNNGLTWNTLVDNHANTGAYEWNVPNSLSTQCLIKVSDAADGNPTDQSNATFSITPKPELKILYPIGGETWTAGIIDTIRWSSIGIENVFIDYTPDNGKSWTTIVEKTPSNGKYGFSFTSPGSEYKIRIIDADNKSPVSLSNGTFTVLPEPKINVIAPNGNEEWYAGSSNSIRWSSTNIENVKIEFTTNNGATWVTIVSSTPSTGAYSWQSIPNVSSLQCRVRISEATRGIPSDISDNNFTITNPGTQLIKVTSPNGGEKWSAGTPHDITWDASGIANVKIEYTINNGVSWNTIVASTPSTGFYTWNQVPNSPATNCKIRISDASDGAPSDESDSFFTIGPAASIKVLVPNGNDTWLSGSTKEIKWSSENVENVKIEFTINGGASWITLTSSTMSTGSYYWTNIPNVNSLQCRVRISDAVNGTPSDISDDNFAIMSPGAQQIKVTSPNGGESWPVGSSQNLTWDAGGIANVKIEYTINNGISWNTIVTSTESDGFYTWNQIPNTPATNCKIRISDAFDESPFDDSDNYFSIVAAPYITVVSPNGGESLLNGSSQEIRWTSQYVENVKIEYTTNNGASWLSIVTNTPSTGTYTWNPIPIVSSLQCRIKVSDAVQGIPWDVSDNNFTISYPGAQLIKVTSPNGGENWIAGSSQKITWDAAGITNVKIEYTLNNGISWNTIIASTPSTGFYNWSQVPNTLSTNCKIRISDAQDGAPFDDSDQFFSIVPAPDIKVLSPNGGETYQSGTNQEIRWTSENVENVKIEYSTNAGALWNTIVSSTPSIGTYTWASVPNANSYQCRIRISDAVNGSPYDVSDNNFTISNQTVKSIKVITPNGGEKWREKQTKSITWSSSGIDRVDLFYSTDGSRTWNVIASNLQSTGSYDWTIPAGINSTQCKIRINDSSQSSNSDESDASFSILLTPEIKQIIFPANGTEIIAGQSITIQWESTGISAVKIEYNYINVAVPSNWITLVDSVQNSGSYNTSFSTVSDNYVIRISATDKTASMNSGVFKVKKAPTITILKPNGGEQWLTNNSFEISWIANNINNVKIEYSTNGGGLWKTISANTPNDGTYNWVPTDNDSSDNSVVRISEAVTGTPSDISDNVFSIHKNKKVRVVSPNGGESYKNSLPINIIWTTFAVSNVNVYYSINNGVSWVLLQSNIQSTGAYVWNPVGLISGQARIKVEDVSNPALYDVSDGFFSILP